MHSTMAYRQELSTVRWGVAAPASSPTTAAAAPAATQRSCWRSTPRAVRKRSTTQASTAMLANQRMVPTPASTPATVPAGPASPNGLAIGWSSSREGARAEPTRTRAAAATAMAATGRQRRERSRPSGTSSAGRVTPRTVAGAQLNSPHTAAAWATSGSGRCSPTNWESHGSVGMGSDHASPAAAKSQPIGLAGRRSVRTSPTVAKPSG
jgi:hypothetical protein